MKLNGNTYKSYKGSSVLWAKEIPSHWAVEKGKWLFHRNERKVRKVDEVVTCFRDGEVTLRKNRRLDGFTNSLKEHGYQGIRKGDLVIHGMDAFAGSIGISDSDGKSTPVYNVLTERFRGQIDLEYYCYLFRYLAHSNFILSLAKGIRERSTDFRFSDIAKLEYVLPPKPEQTAIANFLDDKTTKIDQAIAQKERMIELLQERKQIIIQNAVTKGLDPNVKMKESGVKWIGEIPEHWGITEIRKLCQTTSGGTPSSGNRDRYYNGKHFWIRTTDLNNEVLNSVPEKITDIAIKETACKVVPMHTVCIAMYGGSGTIGKHSIITFEATLNQALCGIIPSSKVNPFYIYYYSKFYRPHWMFVAKGSRKDPNISQDEVRRMKIPFLSIEEQNNIVDFLNNKINQINRIIKVKNLQIEKLKEYKTTLIDHAVTGKIKVSELG